MPTTLCQGITFDKRCCAAQVLLTREEGKNQELKERLYQEGIAVVEVPLVQTDLGPDR